MRSLMLKSDGTKMFPDNDIATRMKLGRTKATHIANFGILTFSFNVAA